MRVSDEQLMTAEKSVLSAAMLEPWATRQVVEKLTPQDFRNKANRAMFLAIKKLHEEGKFPDFSLMHSAVGDDESLARMESGGIGYLLEVVNFVPSAVNVEHYIVKVQENAREARTRDEIDNMIRMGGLSYDALERLVEREKASIRPVGDGTTTAEMIGDYLDNMYDGKARTLITTGLPTFDNDSGALPCGSVSIIAARPRHGKTAIALDILNHNINSGIGGSFFSGEMTRAQLLDRLAAIRTGIPYSMIHKGRLTDGHKAMIAADLAEITDGNRVHVFDDVRSVGGIIAEIERTGAKLSIIDYIQKIRPDKDTGSRHHDIESILDRLKEVAIRFDCHICVLSQISRAGADKPQLEHLKESGSLEEGGDIIMLLHRDSEDGGRTLKDTGSLIIAKHKYGECGYLPLHFNGNRQLFTEVARE